MTIKKRNICSVCAREKSSSYCDFCKKETPTNLSIELFDKVKLRGSLQLKFKELGKGVISIIRSGWKSSGNPKITEGVYEDRIIDRRKKEYHQVVKDAKTGKVLHEEHEPLNIHKGK